MVRTTNTAVATVRTCSKISSDARSYIPVKVDYSDLYDIMAFFLGRPTDGQGAHDEFGHKIAEAGRLWARDHWRYEDMSSYMFRLILEFARVTGRSGDEELDYILPDDDDDL